MINSSRQVVVRSRNICRQISRQSTTLHGRGWYRSKVNSIGQIAQVRGDEEIHTAGVGGESGAVGGRQGGVGIFGDPPQAHAARFAVGLQQIRAENLGQVPGGEAAQRIHLPEAVLRRDVALDEKRVVQAGGADVRLSQRIERYGGCRCHRSRRRHPTAAAGAARQTNKGSAVPRATAIAIEMFTSLTARATRE